MVNLTIWPFPEDFQQMFGTWEHIFLEVPHLWISQLLILVPISQEKKGVNFAVFLVLNSRELSYLYTRCKLLILNHLMSVYDWVVNKLTYMNNEDITILENTRSHFYLHSVEWIKSVLSLLSHVHYVYYFKCVVYVMYIGVYSLNYSKKVRCYKLMPQPTSFWPKLPFFWQVTVSMADEENWWLFYYLHVCLNCNHLRWPN